MALTALSAEFHALTDTGRVRPHNEDAVAVCPQAGLMLLADGMGGYSAGEVASALAVQHMQEQLTLWLTRAKSRKATPDAVAQALQAAAESANQAILAAGRAQPQWAGMGTTLVAGVLHGGHLVLGHAGDSRGYVLRGGVLRQLTRDHSWLQEQIDAGHLTPGQAAAAPGLRNLVTRALGAEAVLHLETTVLPVQAGDLYLLCSDGLTDLMTHQDMQTLAAQAVPLAAKARRLVARANALGGRDNISVVLAQVAPPAAGQPASAAPAAPAASPSSAAPSASALPPGAPLASRLLRRRPGP